MPQLHFQYDASREQFLVIAPSGRTYCLRPIEYERALLQAELLISGGAQELLLEAPGIMRLRIGGCARSTYERTVQLMRETWHYHEDKTLQQYAGNIGGQPLNAN